MSSIVFKNDHKAIVDKWLDDSDEKSSRNDTATSIALSKPTPSRGVPAGNVMKGSSSDNKASKAGLGFQGLQQPKEKGSGNVLMDRILQQKKQAKSKSASSAGPARSASKVDEGERWGGTKKRSERDGKNEEISEPEEEEEEETELHGITESFPDSRIASSSSKHKRPKFEAATKPQVQPKKDDAANDTSTSSKPKQQPPSRPKQVSLGIRPGKGGYWAQVYEDTSSGSGTGAGSDGGPEKRRRPKTRSKQKNIRKDNRPLDARPAFRPLSSETKRIIESAAGTTQSSAAAA
jgi:hypothetical protein